jgi:hypothetical protein
MDIPPDKLMKQDRVFVLDNGPAGDPYPRPIATCVHATEAKEAIGRDPARYALDAPHFHYWYWLA